MLASWSIEIWKENTPGNWIKDTDLFYRVFDLDNGNFVTDEIRIDDGSNRSQILNQIEVLENGAFNLIDCIVSLSAPPDATSTVSIDKSVTVDIALEDVNEEAPFATVLFVTTYLNLTTLLSDSALPVIPSPK